MVISRFGAWASSFKFLGLFFNFQEVKKSKNYSPTLRGDNILLVFFYDLWFYYITL